MTDFTFQLKPDDLGVLSEIVREAQEAGERAERALLRMRTHLTEANDVLAELRTQRL